MPQENGPRPTQKDDLDPTRRDILTIIFGSFLAEASSYVLTGKKLSTHIKELLFPPKK